jgi:hypothetical protein
MSCVPNEVALAALDTLKAGGSPPRYRCPGGALLPCFLEFETYDAPRSDNSHMRCRPLRRKAPEAAADSCSPAIQALLQEQAATVAAGRAADAGGSAPEQWDLPPAYYQYQGCSCMHGWKDAWSADGTVLACVPDRQLLEPWAWVLVALAGVLFLLCAALLLVASRWVLFRSRWVREAELRRKRARWGSLKAGARLSVVVTDIEGYSGERARERGSSGGGVLVCDRVPTLASQRAQQSRGWAFFLLRQSSRRPRLAAQRRSELVCPPLPALLRHTLRADQDVPPPDAQGCGHAQRCHAQGCARPGRAHL